MNRKILFRGKRVDNGEWVCGVLTCMNYIDVLTQKVCYDGQEEINYCTVEHCQVDKNTVGQFTGLCDKNGNKIFEGDIVKIAGDSNNDDWKNVNYIAQIVFLDGGFCAIDGTIDNYSFRRYSLSRFEFDLEVIGNIHDNPELLEVEQ